ncbi:MAG TPA: BON domain-containing protein [Blastocatellia bacterium]|nr:BON domain-containing protein [Blastocatellia bacterium]
MRKPVALIILLLLIAGVGYYVYRQGWKKPEFISSLFSSGDTATTAKVKAALGLSKRVSAYNIGVATNDGVVTLTGKAPSEDVKSLAAEIARDTEGVKEVDNQVEVNPTAQPTSESVRVEDLEIRTAILESFARSPELGGKPIDIKVENRIVTLSGTVDTPAQKNGAEQSARAVDGVAGVTNSLAVANPQAATEPPATGPTPVDPGPDLAKRVKFELYDTGAFDTLTMNVTVEEGAVTLSGTVRTRAEQLLAERVAQGVPGVKKVTNQLKVAAAPARR